MKFQQMKNTALRHGELCTVCAVSAKRNGGLRPHFGDDRFAA
jgi:hypothetical protein